MPVQFTVTEQKTNGPNRARQIYRFDRTRKDKTRTEREWCMADGRVQSCRNSVGDCADKIDTSK